MCSPTATIPQVILIATGSRSVARGRGVREAQGATASRRASSRCRAGSATRSRTEAYKESVLPKAVTARLAIEMAGEIGWDRYVGLAGQDDHHVDLRRLGAARQAAGQVRLHGRQCRSKVAEIVMLETERDGTQLNDLESDYGARRSGSISSTASSSPRAGCKKLVDEDGLTGVTRTRRSSKRRWAMATPMTPSSPSSTRRNPDASTMDALRASRDPGHPGRRRHAAPGL